MADGRRAHLWLVGMCLVLATVLVLLSYGTAGPSADLAVLRADWRALPPGPLSPRGAAESFATGSEVFVVGGMTDLGRPHVECSVDASGLEQCGAGPSLRYATDAAAIDVAAGTWRKVTAAPSDPADMGWSWVMHADGDVGVGRRGPLYWINQDEWILVPPLGDPTPVACCPVTQERLELNPDADRWWTGSELLTVGCAVEPGGRHRLFAASWAPGQHAWHQTPLGGHGPCLVRGAARIDLRLVALASCGDGHCSENHDGAAVLAVFDVASGEWSVHPTDLTTDTQLATMGGQLIAIGPASISRVDVDTGTRHQLSVVPTLEQPVARMAASSELGVAFVDRDQATIDLWWDRSTSRWFRLPPLPDHHASSTASPVVELAGHELVVWGGMGSMGTGRNSNDGYALPVSRAGTSHPWSPIRVLAAICVLATAGLALRLPSPSSSNPRRPTT